jgi:hypothetical protein
MSDTENRRTSARILTEFPLVLLSETGEELDAHAVAHDVSEKGFKAESRAELAQGQVVRFRLGIDASGDVTGRARFVWCQRTDLSYWGGAQFLGLSRGDRRRVRRVTNPSDVDWSLIVDRAIIALGATLATLLAWIALSSTLWAGLLSDLFPKIVAALLAGWALRELLRREKR